MKKLITLILSVLFIISCLCLTASAADGYVWPMIGYDFGRGFSWENGAGHNGIDITNTPTGDPIYAVMSGEVVCASMKTPGKTDRCSSCQLEAGYHILVKQTDGLYAVYAHLSNVLVKNGDKVTSGQKIGQIGSTGNSTGPHLHLTLFNQTDTGWYNFYSPIDPLTKITPFCDVYVDEITDTNAKIHGKLGSRNFTMVDGGIYIGTDPNNMTKITENINSGEIHNITEIFYGLNKWGVTLKKGTTYYYQVWVSRYGKEYKSELYKFTAGDASSGRQKANIVVNTPEKFNKVWVSNLGETNAQINAQIDLQWITEAGFYIGASKDDMTKHPEKLSSGMNVDNIFYDLNKWGVTLKEGTTYYYQLYYIKNGTTYKSDIRTFTTTGCEHTPTIDYKEASCTTAGKIVRKCSKCGEILYESTISAKGHSFDSGVITKNPTSTTTGVKTYTCQNCKEIKDEIIPVIEDENKKENHEHTAGAWTVEKEATCTEEGKKVQRCTECSEVVATEIIAKTNHRFDDGIVIKEATATEVGKKLYTCEICAFAKVEDIPGDTSETVIESPFTDVPKTEWYYSTIITVYQNKLMMGNSLTTFNPTGTMTLAEAITIATRIHHKNATGQDLNVLGGANWYDAYVNYAIEKGIIKDTDFTSYSTPATRGEMAYIFSHCVSRDDLVEINDNVAVPDVYDDYKYADEIKALYKSGVIAGSDEIGRYYPERDISRAEVAMIVARLTKLVNRVQK